MSQYHIFQEGDKCYYTGQKHYQELTRDGKPLVGWIHAVVDRQENTYIVFYPETKHQDSFVLHASLLTAYRPSQGKRDDGPIIAPRRKKKDDDL